MSVWDIARQLKLPGVVVQAHVDPTQISPRIKKAAQKMLRSGKLKGGWNSKSLQVARHLLKGHNLPVLSGWDTWYRTRPLSPSDIAEFDQWFEADFALEKMKMTDEQKSSRWYTKHLDENVEQNKQAIRKVNATLQSFYLRIDNEDIRDQVNDRLLELRSPEDVAALNALADRLDDATPIPIQISI